MIFYSLVNYMQFLINPATLTGGISLMPEKIQQKLSGMYLFQVYRHVNNLSLHIYLCIRFVPKCLHLHLCTWQTLQSNLLCDNSRLVCVFVSLSVCISTCAKCCLCQLFSCVHTALLFCTKSSLLKPAKQKTLPLVFHKPLKHSQQATSVY